VIHLGLIGKNLLRNRRRSILTALGVAVAIFVYAALQAAVDGILFPVRQANKGGLLNVRERGRGNVLASRLPESLEGTLSATPGISAATGVFTSLAVVGERRVHIFIYGVDDAYRAIKDLRIDDAAWARFREDRQAAIVGNLLAQQMGWEEGAQVELKEAGLSFRVAALLPPQGEQSSDLERHLLVHRAYLQQARGNEGQVTVVLVKPREGAGELQLAEAIDARTAVTASPTETASEAAYAQKIVEQFVSFVDYLKVMAFLTIVITLFGAANAVSMNVRERVREIAVFRALGYTPGALLGLIVAEAALLSGIGGMVGLALAAGALGARGAVLAGLHLSPATLVIGFVSSILIGAAGGLLPGLSAVRMTISDALRVVD